MLSLLGAMEVSFATALLQPIDSAHIKQGFPRAQPQNGFLILELSAGDEWSNVHSEHA